MRELLISLCWFLYAIGSLIQGKDRLLPYSEVDEQARKTSSGIRAEAETIPPRISILATPERWGLGNTQ